MKLTTNNQPPFPRPPVRPNGSLRGLPQKQIPSSNNDPHEFTNLADNSAHQQTLTDLKNKLHKWRADTKDPLLKEQNLTHLQSEINASFQNGKPEKSKLHLSYPDYFFKN